MGSAAAGYRTTWSRFEVMRKREIDDAFAIDEHFARQGSELLDASS